MNNSIKILIVAVLAAVVAIAVALKKVSRSPNTLCPSSRLKPSYPSFSTWARVMHPLQNDGPILEEFEEGICGPLEVVFIDVWQTPDAGKQYGIDVIPTQIFYDVAGKEFVPARRLFLPRTTSWRNGGNSRSTSAANETADAKTWKPFAAHRLFIPNNTNQNRK